MTWYQRPQLFFCDYLGGERRKEQKRVERLYGKSKNLNHVIFGFGFYTFLRVDRFTIRIVTVVLTPFPLVFFPIIIWNPNPILSLLPVHRQSIPGDISTRRVRVRSRIRFSKDQSKASSPIDLGKLETGRRKAHPSRSISLSLGFGPDPIRNPPPVPRFWIVGAGQWRDGAIPPLNLSACCGQLIFLFTPPCPSDRRERERKEKKKKRSFGAYFFTFASLSWYYFKYKASSSESR